MMFYKVTANINTRVACGCVYSAPDLCLISSRDEFSSQQNLIIPVMCLIRAWQAPSRWCFTQVKHLFTYLCVMNNGFFNVAASPKYLSFLLCLFSCQILIAAVLAQGHVCFCNPSLSFPLPIWLSWHLCAPNVGNGSDPEDAALV